MSLGLLRGALHLHGPGRDDGPPGRGERNGPARGEPRRRPGSRCRLPIDGRPCDGECKRRHGRGYRRTGGRSGFRTLDRAVSSVKGTRAIGWRSSSSMRSPIEAKMTGGGALCINLRPSVNRAPPSINLPAGEMRPSGTPLALGDCFPGNHLRHWRSARQRRLPSGLCSSRTNVSRPLNTACPESSKIMSMPVETPTQHCRSAVDRIASPRGSRHSER